jgi:hypothetical protein
MPYHTTSVKEADICAEMPEAITIKEFNAFSGAFSNVGICSAPDPIFEFTKGRAVKVLLKEDSVATPNSRCAGCLGQGGAADCTGTNFVNWTPNHF